MKLDDRDLALLSILQRDARSNLSLVAEEVGLSLASVQRRLKKMRENGVISAEVAVVSPQAASPLVTCLVEIQLERDNPDILARFKARVKKETRIQQCYYVTGERDFVLVVNASSMEDFEQFCKALFHGENYVRHYQTSVVMERTKLGLELPLELLAGDD